MIKIQKKNEEKINMITDMSISMANAVRRSVNEIPILAVDELEISKNDSALYDEIIAHRLGLIPLKNEKLKLPEECGCKGKGCGKCSIKLKLKAKGPCVVYSTDLSPKGNSIYKIPIVLLDKNQELEFAAIAKTGKGINHAKFVPGIIYYKYSEDIEKSDVEEDDKKFAELTEKVKKDNDKEIIMYAESWGQIKSKEIFAESINVLLENLKKFSKEIK